MRKIILCCAAMIAVLGLATLAGASSVAPEFYAMIGDERFVLEAIQTETGWLLPAVQIENAEGKIDFGGATIKTDPFIAYGIAVVDFGAPTVFGFGFFTPIVLPALPTTITASIVGGLTDVDGFGVTLTALNPPNPFQGGISYTQDNSLVGVPFVWSAGLTAAFGPGAPGSFYAYGPFAFGPAAGPAGPFAGFFGTTTTFSLTGGGDIAVLTGYCSINPVPVPPSVLLLGTGLLSLAGLRLRKK